MLHRLKTALVVSMFAYLSMFCTDQQAQQNSQHPTLYLQFNPDHVENSRQRSTPTDITHDRQMREAQECQQYLLQKSLQRAAEALVAQWYTQLQSTVHYQARACSSLVANSVYNVLQRCNNMSSYDLLDAQSQLTLPLPQLQHQLELLTEQNSRIDRFIHDEQYGHFHGSRLIDRDRWSMQDYAQGLQALQLKMEIDARTTASKQIDDKIKEESQAIQYQTTQASVETLQQEILPNLIAQQTICINIIAQKKEELKIVHNKLKSVEDQLEYYYNKRTVIGRWANSDKIDALAQQQESLNSEAASINHDIASLNYDHNKYQKWIDHAQQNLDTKQAALKEAQRLEQQAYEQEMLNNDATLLQDEPWFSDYDRTIINQYSLLNFELENCPDACMQDQWQARQEALLKTIEQDYKQYCQSYNISNLTLGCLAAHGIDYKEIQTFSGTALQHQFHSEICDVFEQSATLKTQFSHQNHLLASVVDFADAAHDANKNQQILLVSELLNVDCMILKLARAITSDPITYLQALACQTSQSVIDLGHAIIHPVQTCQKLGKIMYFVLESAALNDPENWLMHPEIFEPLREQRNAEIFAGLQILGEKMNNSTELEQFKILARFGADYMIPHKITQAIAGACGLIRSQQIEAISALEGATEAATHLLEQDLKVEALGQELIQATEKSQAATQEMIGKQLAAELMEAPAKAKKTNSVLPKRCKLYSQAEVITEIQRHKGKIPASKVDLLHNAEYWLKEVCAKVNTQIETALLEQYEKMTLIAGKVDMSVCMDLQHIVNITYKLKKDSSGAFHTVKLAGGHLAGTISKLAKEKLVDFKISKEFRGCIEYEVTDLLTGSTFTHTEFPPHWNAEKIAQETKSLVESAIANGSLTEKTPVVGKISEGFELKIIIDSAPEIHNCVSIENTINKHVVTSYPYKR